MTQAEDSNWHHTAAADVLRSFEANTEQGLTEAVVQERLRQYGGNVLTLRRGTGPFLMFLRQFHQPLVYILLAAAGVTAWLYEWVDAGVITGVVLVNAVIGFVQEHRARRAIEALGRTMTSQATVLRSGQPRRLAAADLVPGDIVLLQSGDKVPADLRVLRTRELRVDESALTGESMPVEKRDVVLAVDTALGDRVNMAYASTLVTYGTGVGVVTSTGDATEIGRINALIGETDELETPLTRRLEQFSRLLLVVILALSGLTFLIGVVRGQPAVEMFMAAVSLAVGAIPEGLPAAMTITLALGVAKMAQRHAIVRKLPAVETLGSTTVVCSDKTGTLTQNEMTVQEVWAGDETWDVSGVGYAPAGEFVSRADGAGPAGRVALEACVLAGVLCNDSRLKEATGTWHVEGDPTEAALLTAGRKAGLEDAVVQQAWPRLDAIPFESQHQYMATLHAGPGDARTVFLKGAVESVLSRCSQMLGADGETRPLMVDEVLTHVSAMTEEGLRVLAFARADWLNAHPALEHEHVASGLTFLGLQGMIDPPRPEAIAAVRACQRAGVRVKMITGDHAGTAAAIAAQIGLEGTRDAQGIPRVLTGRDLKLMDHHELVDAASSTAVFARVEPEQKLRLVEALQATGQVVAMTGDGVNDAPALRRADIGIAMGITGTEAAKEAAAMVLADDNFSSIEAAIEEGRGVYDNLVKFLTWTLPTNLGEGLVIFAAILAAQPLPITPVQILWINMTTSVLLGLTLAFEPREPGIMHRPPRDPQTPILTRPLLGRIALVGVLLLVGAFGIFEWEIWQGESEAKARTAAVSVFVFGELFYLFNCRSLRDSLGTVGLWTNPWTFLGAGAMTLMQLAFIYVPFMQVAFGSAPIGPAEWVLVLAYGGFIFVVVGLEKWVRRRRTQA